MSRDQFLITPALRIRVPFAALAPFLEPIKCRKVLSNTGSIRASWRSLVYLLSWEKLTASCERIRVSESSGGNGFPAKPRGTRRGSSASLFSKCRFAKWRRIASGPSYSPDPENQSQLRLPHTTQRVRRFSFQRVPTSTKSSQPIPALRNLASTSKQRGFL